RPQPAATRPTGPPGPPGIAHRRARIWPPQGAETTGRPGPAWRGGIVNRTQPLVLGFFATVLVVLIGILVLAPGTYDEALSLPAGGGLPARLVVLATLSAFIWLVSVWGILLWHRAFLF